MSGPELVMLAALDRQRAIGRGNALPWRLPDDLKRFKSLTLGKPILMGRKTAESLGRALPGRLNLVLSRQPKVPFSGMQRVPSLEAALQAAGDAERLCVIGGGEVYALCLPLAARMFLTHVDTQVVAADAWFPLFKAEEWHVEAREGHRADVAHAFDFEFVDYRRRR